VPREERGIKRGKIKKRRKKIERERERDVEGK